MHPSTSRLPKWARPLPQPRKLISLSRALSRPVLGYGLSRRPLLPGPSLRARSDAVTDRIGADHTRRVRRQGLPTCVILSFSDSSGPGNRTPESQLCRDSGEVVASRTINGTCHYDRKPAPEYSYMIPNIDASFARSERGLDAFSSSPPAAYPHKNQEAGHLP